MKINILFLPFFITHLIIAQELTLPTLGEITQPEMEMSGCQFDSAANAVVLFDLGKSRFIRAQNGFDIRFTRHRRIKILDKAGVNKGKIAIPYYVESGGEREKIKSIEAYTHNFNDGQWVKHELDPSTVYDEKINQWWHQKKFVFPNAREGSIIEFKYIHETPFLFNLPDWEFQSRIPTLYSQYQISMIPFYEYVRLLQGADTLDFQQSLKGSKNRYFAGVEYHDYIHTYAMENIEAFKDESYITSINDYIMKLDFQLAKIYYPNGTSEDIISTWPELNEGLLNHENFGKYLKNCRRYAKKVLKEKIDTTNQSNSEKIKTLVRFVKEDFYWNGSYSKYASQSAKDFMTNKSGNSAEVNLFLLALLREAGIEADPVVISTRDNGKIKLAYPYSKALNYVMVWIDGEISFLTDATDKLLNYNIVPTRCVNDYGLVVDKNKNEGKWLQIAYKMPSLNEKRITIDLDAETNHSELSVSIASDFFEAYHYRSTYKNEVRAIEEGLHTTIDEIDKIETKNYNSFHKPYIISIQGKKKMLKIGNYYVLNPFLGLSISENKLKQENRTYPVDMVYPSKHQYHITIRYTDDYAVKNVPSPYSLKDDLIELDLGYTIEPIKNELYILGNYTFKKSVYSPSEYKKLQEGIDLIIEKFNQELFFERNN